MDVHYSPKLMHQPSKRATHVLEFVMLFLAVTLGFLAENLRAHLTDLQKEKHYLQSLRLDISSDLKQLKEYVQFKTRLLHYCDSLQFAITHTNVLTHSNAFYTYSRELARYSRYYPTDQTYEQLKNGDMRLIRWELSSSVVTYYSHTKFLEEVDQELNDEVQRYRRYIIELMDLSSYDRVNPPGSFLDNPVRTRGNPGFISTDVQKIKVVYNEAFALKAFLSNSIRYANEQIGEANRLTALLPEE